ncbi:MAG: hypothetical protein Q8942_08110 [Bacillota bacterium]|nr:hypothetical protein [Bacillota bacterium]
MKALIVEIEGNYAVAMRPNGTFVKVKNSSKYSIGCEAEIPSMIFVNFKTLMSAASAALFLIVMGISFFLYNNPYSYVDIDINPSIEITTNVFDRIINVRALNPDAEKIINNLSFKNKVIEAGVDQIINKAIQNGYLKDERTDAIMLTVSGNSSSKNKKLQKVVLSTAQKKFKEEKINPEVLTEEVTSKKHDAAIKQGIYPGKLELVNKLLELNPKLQPDDLKSKSVKEIVKSIREYTKSQTKKNNKIKSPTKDGNSSSYSAKTSAPDISLAPIATNAPRGNKYNGNSGSKRNNNDNTNLKGKLKKKDNGQTDYNENINKNDNAKSNDEINKKKSKSIQLFDSVKTDKERNQDQKDTKNKLNKKSENEEKDIKEKEIGILNDNSDAEGESKTDTSSTPNAISKKHKTK